MSLSDDMPQMIELSRLRSAVIKAARDADYALAGEDPHDWRKGLEIIRTDLVRELESDEGGTNSTRSES